MVVCRHQNCLAPAPSGHCTALLTPHVHLQLLPLTADLTAELTAESTVGLAAALTAGLTAGC